MTDKMLYSLSIFLTGLGAGIALAAFVARRSCPAKSIIDCASDEDLLDGKAAASSH